MTTENNKTLFTPVNIITGIFLAIGLAFDFLARWLKNIYRYSAWIHLISGLLLIAVGVLVLTNRMFWFQTLVF